jgi:hypothetical protein
MLLDFRYNFFGSRTRDYLNERGYRRGETSKYSIHGQSSKNNGYFIVRPHDRLAKQ